MSLFLAACSATSTIQPPDGEPGTQVTQPPVALPVVSVTPSRTPALVATAIPGVTLQPIPAVHAQDWSRGPDQASITLLLYSDFQCALCRQVALALNRIQARHPQQIRIVFRHYPLLELYDKSPLAAQAVEAAGNQDAFWPMYDLLYEHFSEWSELPPEEFQAWLFESVANLDLDPSAFDDAMQQGLYEDEIKQAYRDALAMGLPGAPFIMLNGEPYRTALSEVNLEAAVSLTLFEQRQFDAEPEMNLDQQANYEARIELTSGEHLVANLYPNAAPRAINNFLFLARQGYYDDIPFYRVLPGLWVESGDPSGTGFGDPGYFIPQEIDPVLHFDRPGVLAMNSPSPGLSGGRFVITLTALPQLDGQMTIIGQVREGLEQLEALMARDPFLDLLIVPEFMIETIEIEVSR